MSIHHIYPISHVKTYKPINTNNDYRVFTNNRHSEISVLGVKPSRSVIRYESK